MADQFSGIERLLGLPQGSTKNINPDDAAKVLAKGVKDKTDQLEKDLEKVETLETMSPPDLVKCGISMEILEQDKITLRNEAFEVYRIAKAILIKFYGDTKDQIDVNDRMYASAAKLVESVTNSVDKLLNMNMKFRQEEEMKNIALVGEDDDGKREMSPTGWIDFVDEVKDKEDVPDFPEVQDAEIVDDEGG